MTSFNTTILNGLIARIQSGDPDASDAAWELIQFSLARLEAMTRATLRGFPNVARFEQTDDVLTNALLRLLPRLKRAVLPTTRDYFSWASIQIRQELIETLRRLNRKTKPTLPTMAMGDTSAGGMAEPADAQVDDPDDLERWTLFHETVGRIPDVLEREVFELNYYQGLSPAEIAEVMGITVQQVYPARTRARDWLRRTLGANAPEILEP